MYHFSMPYNNYDNAFFQRFTKKHTDHMKTIKGWKYDQGKLKWKKLGMYPIEQLPSPYCYGNGMLCIFFPKQDTTRFSIDWVPLIDAIFNSSIMNWESIFSDNFARNIMDYRSKISVSSRTIPPFYINSYIMDAI